MNADPQTLPTLDSLGVVADATARADETLALAARHLDPSLVDVLRILGFDKEYVSAQGSYLYDAAGRAYLDFHTGEGFASLGHNHPDVREVLQATLAADLVDGVQIHYSALAGMLAEALAQRLPDGARRRVLREHRRRGGRLGDEVRARRDRAAAPDLLRQQLPRRHARAALARRRRVLQGGLRPAAARLRARPVRRPRRASRRSCARKDVAAFIVEPIQGRDGDAAARRLSAGRAGAVPALRHAVRRSTRSRPGSDAPASGSRSSTGASSPTSCSSARRSAAATCRSPRWSRRREIYQRAVGTLERSYVHQSTFGRNRLSMAAGLATLRIIERDGLVEHAARDRRACCATASRELQQRYEMIKEVRASGLMIGIELRRAELARRAAELAPDPHGERGPVPAADRDPAAPRPRRDHDGRRQERRDQAAAAADAVRGARRSSFLGALDAVLADCDGAGEQELGASCATSPRRRCVRRRASRPRERRRERLDRAFAAGRPDATPRATTSAWSPARPASSAGAWPSGLAREATTVRCLVRASSDTSLLERLDVEIAVGDLTERALARTRRRRLPTTSSTAARSSPTGRRRRRSRRPTSTARATCSRPPPTHPCGASSTSARPTSTAIPAARRSTRRTRATRFRNWYAQTKLDAEAEVRRAERERALDAVILRPATVYGPGSTRRRRRDRARDPRPQHAAGRRRPRGRRALLRREPDRRRRARAAPRRRARARVQRQRRARRHLAGVHRRPRRRARLPAGALEPALLDRQRRSASRSSTATGSLRRTTGLSAPPLLSRQAVQVLGTQPGLQQPQGARDARLGAARRLLEPGSRRRSPGLRPPTSSPPDPASLEPA